MKQAPAAENATGRRRRWRYLWVLGLALYGAAVIVIGLDPLQKAVASVRLELLLAMAAVMALSLWLRAMKWRWALGPGQHAFGLFFLSKAGGGYSPARIGELAPLAIKRHRSARLAAWIVIDRLLETGATIGLGLAGVIALGAPQSTVAIVFAAAMAVLVIVPFFVLTRRRWFERMAGFFSAGSLPHRLCTLLVSLSDEVADFRARLPVAAGWSLACTGLDLLAGMLLYYGFGHVVPFHVLAVAQCAHGLASVLPFLPNATGGPYLVAAGILYQFGAVPTEVLAAAVGVNVALSNVLFWASFMIGSTELGKDAPEKKTGQAALFDYLAAGDALYSYAPESLARIDALAPKKGRVLDVGCGDGAIARALTAETVIGADISPRCAYLTARHGVPAVVADAARGFPFASAAFDTVYCVDVLHHLHGRWDAVLDEASRVLKPAGRLVVVEPDAQYALVRWTQAPKSPIRVAPYADEPAIRLDALLPLLTARGYTTNVSPIRIDGAQVRRSVFPLWQRLAKAPFVLALAWWHGGKPNKFAVVAVRKEVTE